MTPERFCALADAYGGNLERWPLAERDAARRHLLSRPAAQADLQAAAWLDAALAAWTVPGPGAALAARIALSVGQRRARMRRVRLWLASLGLATSLAGGVAAGMTFVALSMPAAEQATAPLYELSVFGAALDAQAPAAGGHS